MRPPAQSNYQLADQLLEATVCRESLHEFVRYAWKLVEPVTFVDGWHLHAICEHLEAVTRGTIQRLLINVPPGFSKSLITCVFWPMWEWAQDPSVKWFFASYDQRLSTRDSIRCRALMETSWYQRICARPFELRYDANQKTHYETDAGGYRMATSIGGHGTGEHMTRIVVDDPNNVRQAESEVERQAVLDWWDMTMSTRGISLGARRVIIMQRLHEQDLSGHVLRSGEDWTHLCLPMRFEPGRMKTTVLGFNDPRKTDGDLLWPQLFDEDKVKQMERPLGAYGVAGQLQQRPVPRGGGLFRDSFFANNRVRAAPYDARRCIYWDLAHVGSSSACRTVGTVVHEKDGEYFIGPVWVGQWEPYERDARILTAAQYGRDRWGPNNEPTTVIEEEPAAGKDLCRAIIRKLAGYKAAADKVRKSKVDRADAYASQCAAGAIHLIDDGSWDIVGWLKEHATFPNGAYLDQVDSAGGGVNWLAKMRGNRPVGRFRVLETREAKKKDHLRFLFGTEDQLHESIIDQRALLAVIRDPNSGVITVQPATVPNLLGTVELEFVAQDPAMLQERWTTPMAEHGGILPELAVMRPEHGKKLWAQVLKQRQPPAEVVLVVDDDDGRRAKSAAYAACDALNLVRAEAVFDLADPEWIAKAEPAPCEHVYRQTKASRNAVVA